MSSKNLTLPLVSHEASLRSQRMYCYKCSWSNCGKTQRFIPEKTLIRKSRLMQLIRPGTKFRPDDVHTLMTHFPTWLLHLLSNRAKFPLIFNLNVWSTLIAYVTLHNQKWFHLLVFLVLCPHVTAVSLYSYLILSAFYSILFYSHVSSSIMLSSFDLSVASEDFAFTPFMYFICFS